MTNRIAGALVGLALLAAESGAAVVRVRFAPGLGEPAAAYRAWSCVGTPATCRDWWQATLEPLAWERTPDADVPDAVACGAPGLCSTEVTVLSPWRRQVIRHAVALQAVAADGSVSVGSNTLYFRCRGRLRRPPVCRRQRRL